MKIVTGESGKTVVSVMQAIRKNREIWRDWRTLIVEMPFAGRKMPVLENEISTMLSAYESELQGSAYLMPGGEVYVFCKNMPEPVLCTLGEQIAMLCLAETNESANFYVFDVFRDYDDLCEVYHQTDFSSQKRESISEVSVSPGAFLPEQAQRSEDSLCLRQGRKVLLVEDDPVTRWMVRTALKNECLLATAQDAGKALAAYHNYKPDMVLLDINLPDRSGKEVMSLIMRSDPGAYIVMFSSQDTLENIVDTLEEGAKSFISKPFSKENLLKAIQDCPFAR